LTAARGVNHNQEFLIGPSAQKFDRLTDM